jgi:hypothetical protein
VKLKAKLEQLKHGCPDEDSVLEVGEDAELDASTGLDVKTIRVKRPDAADTD